MADEQIEIAAMTPEQAGARLAELAAKPPPPATPTNTAEANARLAALTEDPAWAQRFFAGDVGARREFADLTNAVATGDDIGDIIKGTPPTPPFLIETTINGELPFHARAGAVESMRQAGLDDPSIEQAMRGQKVSRQEFEMAKRYRAMRHSDREWVAKFLNGNLAAQRESLLLSIILSSETDDSK